MGDLVKAHQNGPSRPEAGLPGLPWELRSADGIFAVDLDQRIIYWAPSAEQILGYTAGEVVGRLCYDVIGGAGPSEPSLLSPSLSYYRQRPSPPPYSGL